jgi:hypothetical protein
VGRAAGLGPQRLVEPVRGERGDGAVGQLPRRVHDRRQRSGSGQAGEQVRHRGPVRDVALHDLHRRARVREVRHQCGGSLGGHAAAARQHQAAHPACRDEVARHQRPHATGPAGDQDGPAAEVVGQVEDELADVPSLAHLAERGARVVDGPDGDRVEVQPLLGEQVHDGPEHLLDPVRARLVEVEGLVGDARVVGRDPGGVADVGLAHLDEAAAGGEQGQRGVDVGVREGVQHDVHAAAAGGVPEDGRELQVP